MMPQVLRGSLPMTPSQVVMLFAVITGVLLGLAPRVTAELNATGGAAGMNPGQIEAAARGYIGEWQPLSDPLITLENGTQVKSSNVNGFEIDGTRYYYRLVYGFSADPVSRGRVKNYQVVLVINPGTEWETEIYRVPG